MCEHAERDYYGPRLGEAGGRQGHGTSKRECREREALWVIFRDVPRMKCRFSEVGYADRAETAGGDHKRFSPAREAHSQCRAPLKRHWSWSTCGIGDLDHAEQRTVAFQTLMRLTTKKARLAIHESQLPSEALVWSSAVAGL